MRQADDCCCHILHVQSSILRAYGNYLEKRAPLVWSQEKPCRIQHQNWNHHFDSVHGYRYPEPWPLHLTGRRCLSLFPRPYLPGCYRNRHLLGQAERSRSLQLGAMEESFHGFFWNPRFLDRGLCKHFGYNPWRGIRSDTHDHFYRIRLNTSDRIEL